MKARVAIIGGTHGNEWTGSFICQNAKEILSSEFPNLELFFIQGNPVAFKKNKRYVDYDLNRAGELSREQAGEMYEFQRFIEIKDQISQIKPNLLIDLHTTTSNMETTFIVNNLDSPVIHSVSKCLDNIANSYLLYVPDPNKKYLLSLSDNSCMIEIGPVPQSLYCGRAITKMINAIRILLNHFSGGKSSKNKITYYEEIGFVEHRKDYFIHPEFQNKDFSIMTDNNPVFTNLLGEIVNWNQDNSIPIFINEAAYYTANIAFLTCQKITKRI